MNDNEIKIESDSTLNCKKNDSKDSVKSSEKENMLLRIENRELKDNYVKLKDKYCLLNKKIEMANIKFDEVKFNSIREKSQNIRKIYMRLKMKTRTYRIRYNKDVD